MAYWHHTDFKFHRLVTQIGCYWGGGGHTELYLLEGDRLGLIDTGVATTPAEYVEPALRAIGRSLADVEVVINTPGHTLGCCTLAWDHEGIAFSGDSVLGRGSREGGMPLIFYPDPYRRTIEVVRELRPRVLC